MFILKKITAKKTFNLIVKKVDGNDCVNLSRRGFIRNCAIASAVLAVRPILRYTRSGTLNPRETGAAAFSYSLDQKWLFGGRFIQDAINPGFDDRSFERVTLPHCVTKLSWQNWDPADWEDVWIYRRHFDLPEGSGGRRVFLCFNGVMVAATPVINGHTLVQHLGGYLPFRYEITDWVKEKNNVLAVAVDSKWMNVPPTGTPKGITGIDFLLPGGIHRSVHLEVVPQVFIDDVFAKPVNVLDEGRRIEVACSINAAGAVRKPVRIRVEMRKGAKTVSASEKELRIRKSSTSEVSLTLGSLKDIALWDINAPHLYDIIVTLFIDDEPVHDFRRRIGMRDARFDEDGFFLNGKRLQIFGLDRHELFPYVGYAMPPGVMMRDAEILKHELNCNMVRCSHYPQSEAFLNACDEYGLLVWEEVPGWSYIGDESWIDLILRDVKDMVVRDRNHPSIIVWGVRANETNNYPELWGTARSIAKLLDDSRQTTGAMLGRYRSTRGWVQDVFASNDYSCNHKTGIMELKEPLPGVPYMNSEAVGQVVGIGPTRDHVYRRGADPSLQEKQATYHAQAHDQAAEFEDNSGVTAWCAFDYASLNENAYKGVKYPGVVDFFRVPKLGAAYYQAQVDPDIRPVIRPNFYWDFSDTTPNGPGRNVAIFSNCEKLRLYVDNRFFVEVKPDDAAFTNTVHPPFYVDLEINGTGKPELRIDGYVDARKLLSKSYSADRKQDKFHVEADAPELIGDGSDMVRLAFKVVDKFGEERLYGGGTVSFEIDGPGIIVGDNPFSLDASGGVGGVWIRSLPDSKGKIKVTATHSAFGAKPVELKITQPVEREKV